MKIRNGFVSNSSSSSFIIRKGEGFKNAAEIAKKMIPIREWENDLELVQKLEEMGDYHPHITFSSCNYETYIADVGDFFIIDTCNNHAFDEVFNQEATFEDLPPEVQELFTEGDREYDEYGYNRLAQKFEMWYLEGEDNVIAKSVKYDYNKPYEERHCKKCSVDFVILDGVEQCPYCHQDKNGSTTHWKVSQRTAKINRIKNFTDFI